MGFPINLFYRMLSSIFESNKIDNPG